VADLHTLLRVARVPGPYVLAGHSNGGLFTLLYASTYPRQVAGLVLIDAVHPATIKRRLAMLKPILPPEEWQAARQSMITVRHRLVDPERVDIWTSERQTRVALRRSPIRPMPLVVLAHGPPTTHPRRTSSSRNPSGGSCNGNWPGWSLAADWWWRPRAATTSSTTSPSWSWTSSATSSWPCGPATWCPTDERSRFPG
jgi:pimeloyl-ACP methyl ester carboxylesterase